MFSPDIALTVQLARTLWQNTYRSKVTDSLGRYIASLRLIPAIPLDQAEAPPDAPEVVPYLIVLVEDAELEMDDLVAFETKVADLLMEELAKKGFQPEFCHFFYPSPPAMLGEQ